MSKIISGFFKKRFGLLFLILIGNAMPQVPTTIDVLVIYSGNAKSAAGGTTFIEAAINEAIGDANIAYSNSLSSQRIRLIQMAETPFEYTDPGIMCTSRDRVQNPSDGYLDYIHNLRNQYGADAVALVTNDAVPEFGAGCAFICGYNGTCNSTFENKAFVSVKWDYLDKDVLAHEFGHMMGLMHEREAVGCPDACSQGAAPDGYAFQDQTFNNCWNTVMYSRTVFSACAEREDMFAGIRYFSNPSINHPTKGVPLGIDHNVNPANSSNNARVLREVTRNIVARWRDNSLSGLTLSYNGAFPTNTKMTMAGDGDVHLKGNATVGSGFPGLRFTYNAVSMASVDQNGNAISSGYLENQTSHPTSALRFINSSGQVVKSIGTDGKVRSKALVDINSIP